MNYIKLLFFILVVFLAGCRAAIEIGKLISETNEISDLPPAERCERIHVDLREDCRKKVKKEFDELSEAMSKNKNN